MGKSKIKFAHMTIGMAMSNPWISHHIYQWCGLYEVDVHKEFVTVALIRGEIVGFHYFRLTAGLTLKSWLTYVKLGHRRKGYGKKLWLESERWSAARKMNGFGVSRGGAALLEALRVENKA